MILNIHLAHGLVFVTAARGCPTYLKSDATPSLLPFIAGPTARSRVRRKPIAHDLACTYLPCLPPTITESPCGLYHVCLYSIVEHLRAHRSAAPENLARLVAIWRVCHVYCCAHRYMEVHICAGEIMPRACAARPHRQPFVRVRQLSARRSKDKLSVRLEIDTA